MKRIFKFIIVLLLVPFFVYGLLSLTSYIQGASLIAKNEVFKTEYIFKLGETQKVYIDDSFNKIERSWGNSPHSIKIENGIREIVFKGPAILKTNIDSIEPQKENVRLKGYMGVSTKDTSFYVKESGAIVGSGMHGG